ncbi:UDP-N-acetylmuramoyl-tripeptide--D-alanyl-D-alanine ligase [Bacteroidales bacterium WCE2004]|nr:UDP-N-acetylmuramoyl-tripeptide--D-alanyl-D-alanine ligase [Bacteroidales bacterium WCE2004]
MEDLYQKYLACGGRVTTDSRAIAGGEIFFALRGENFDGNDYAAKALESGAAWAVVNDDAELPADARFIRVADPLQTLRDLAIWHRTHVRDGKLPVLGLTGTNGKTTTKNLIAAVLAKKYRVTATQGNLNNDIGVPLSLLSIKSDTEIAVIEMGANHPDDIAKLVRVSRPDYGLITNVGRAHLLGFGSFEGVKAAKGELYKWLGSHRGSVIFLNEDDPDLREMAAKQPCHTFGYGIAAQGAQILPATPEEPFLRIRLGDALIRTQLVGAYNATNVLAALAVGDYFGVSRADAIAAIAAFAPDNNRSQMVRTQANTLIVDAYNANPSSMRAALDNFRHVQAPRKLALLGDMRELGEESLAEHRKVVRQLRGDGLQACLVGEEFRRALESLEPGDEPWFADSAALAAHLTAHPVRDAVVLVKGSRGIQMEKVLPVL